MTSRKFSAVSTFSWQGKLLVGIIRVLGFLLRPFYYSQRPIPNFEENPAHYRIKDILYFAYKYYLNPPEKAETDELRNYFFQMKFVFPEAAPGAASLTLSSGGDLMPYQWMNSQNSTHLWDEIGPWFFSSDIVLANLETPVVVSKPPSAVPEVMLNDMCFNGDASLFHLFNGLGKYKGFDILSTANNHSMDRGEEGIEETIKFLEQNSILHTGTARNKAEQDSIPVIEKNGIRVAFVAATYCLNHLQVPEKKSYLVNSGRFNLPQADLGLLLDLVKKAREKADFVVLSLHNGNAYQAYPSAHTVDNVHRIFSECGPDLILGSHPHNAQALEQYSFICPHSHGSKQGLAIYSQGDFVAYDIFTWCHLHLGLKFTLSRLPNKSVAITGLEVMPQYLWNGDAESGFDFRFIPLKKTPEFEQKMSLRSKNELAELRRFWQNHLANQLSSLEA